MNSDPRDIFDFAPASDSAKPRTSRAVSSYRGRHRTADNPMLLMRPVLLLTFLFGLGISFPGGDQSPPRSWMYSILVSVGSLAVVALGLYAVDRVFDVLEHKIVPPRARLMSNLRRVEVLGQRLLLRSNVDVRASASPVFAFRAELVKRGIWSMSDLRSFDAVIRLRNVIVHRDANVSRRELLRADREIKRLADKLQVRISEGGIDDVDIKAEKIPSPLTSTDVDGPVKM